MTRRVIAAIASAAAILSATPVIAQDAYPNRPVRLVVGFGAGGPTDIPARHIADKLGNLIGQRIIVENKMGAAGMLATRDVLAQPADGYNLLLCTHFKSINTALYKNPGFKLSDLAPISLIAQLLLRPRRRQRRSGRELIESSCNSPKRSPARSAMRRWAPDRRRKSWRGRSRSSPASR